MTVSTVPSSACEGSTSLKTQPSISNELPLPIRNEMLRFIEEAEGTVTEFDAHLDFVAQLNQVQTVVQWVVRAQKDDTPDLQLVPDKDGLTWVELLQAFHQHGKRLLATPGSKTVLAAPEDIRPLTEVFARAEGLWSRIRLSLDNNKSRPEQAAHLKHLIFGGRSMPRARAAWVTELGLEINVIEKMEHPPPALVYVLPQLRETKRLMSLAVDGRKPPPSTTLYSREIHITSHAINLVLGEFLAWAAVIATPQRLQTFQRLIIPRDRSDDSSASAADSPSEPQEDEVIDERSSEDEEVENQEGNEEEGVEKGGEERSGSEESAEPEEPTES